jgi:hypothetical protein
MRNWKQNMSEQEKSLNRKNGTLRGVEVHRWNPDTQNFEETGAVGWHLSDGGFFIGVGEENDGYGIELAISRGALRRFLAEG